MNVAICIPAYNEGKNLKELLTRLTHESALSEITVVASGCTDDTVEIARSFYPRVKLLVQEKREGKTAAINYFLTNQGLSSKRADVIIVESADTLPGATCIQHLLKPFQDREVGMVGAHPIPLNNRKTIMGQAARIFWNGHHKLSLETPKLGEMIAFRNVIGQIPILSSVDEASIELAIIHLGYKLHYEPNAIVFNKGPETVKDLVKQRARIAIGHKKLSAYNYNVATASPLKTILPVVTSTRVDIKNFIALSVLLIVELSVRIRTQFSNQPEQVVWNMASSTKELTK